MIKIMLVEDDKSLREIYGVRLLAEGYDIVSAGDGEEALAVAIKERPALIISDVMMPKISGFDMLDILRSTTETRNIKVIMMTALSSEEHRLRGEQMGADRYLVKSQVGIEDVVRVVHEVLADKPGAAPAAPTAQPQPQVPTQPAQARVAAPPAQTQTTPVSIPIQSPPPTAPAPSIVSSDSVPRQMMATQPQAPSSQPTAPTTPAPQQAQHPLPPVNSISPAPPSTRQRVIQPVNDPSATVDINALLDRELAREAGTTPPTPISTTAQERVVVQNQLNTLGSTPTPGPVPSAPPTVPAIAISPQGEVSTPQPATNISSQTTPTQIPVRTPGQLQTPPRPPQQ